MKTESSSSTNGTEVSTIFSNQSGAAQLSSRRWATALHVLSFFTISLIVCLSTSLAGCFMYETIQPAEVLEPGAVHAGAALSTDAFGVSTRIGVVSGLDVGARVNAPRSYQIDGKIQLADKPVDISISLAVAHNTLNLRNKDYPDHQSSVGVFPSILVGQTNGHVGWYAGVKALYFSHAGNQGLLYSPTLFETPGWASWGTVLGGYAHNLGIWILLEMSVYTAPGKKSKLMPAFGLQFDLN